MFGIFTATEHHRTLAHHHLVSDSWVTKWLARYAGTFLSENFPLKTFLTATKNCRPEKNLHTKKVHRKKKISSRRKHSGLEKKILDSRIKFRESSQVSRELSLDSQLEPCESRPSTYFDRQEIDHE